MSATEITYGKARVVFYRFAPSSPPLAASVDVDVFGERFLAAYTDGDNRAVVATDTMKNFVYAMAAQYTGSALSGLSAFLAKRFLETYPVMERLRVTVREIALDAASGEQGPSDVLFRATRTDGAVAETEARAVDGRIEITSARNGWRGLVLVKTTGSSFASFARDQYTSLPEVTDRPLTIRLEVWWRYADMRDNTGEGLGMLGPRAVRDELERTFHGFNSRSIQHLVHEMGSRLLAAHPQLAEIEFSAQNHTPDRVDDGARSTRVYAEPRQTFGKIGLVLRR